AAGAMERISQLLVQKPEVVNPIDAKVLVSQGPGRIELENVSFSYPSRPDTLALDKLNLSIKPGEQVALVGASGAGKSTLLQLLLRMFDVSSGSIAIDGHDVRTLDLASLRGRIGIVPQESVIFGISAFENIRFGSPNATRAEVMRAAEIAHADAFLQRLPEGYDTDLGEKGARLSGGQKQRIAIARAVLKDPAILLLDEATSALDSESERLVQSALDALRRERTTLVIAHRLATVLNADRIIVLDAGKVIAEGNHQWLMANEPLYQDMVNLQFNQPEALSPKISLA
ncbi:MAG: ATP-binding cassette domain-containing protein, partial [Pseudomonadales bacterium]|nr:ATP-binding cassette domain-containing protein [Pseudomonadales bacterium]